LRTSWGPSLRMDHTVIDTGHHRLLIATIGAASTNDRYQSAPLVPLLRRTAATCAQGSTKVTPRSICLAGPSGGRDGKIDVLTKEFDELLDIDIRQIDGQHLPVRASDPNDTI